MAQRKLNADFLSQMIEEGAWQELSDELQWTESLLEKYQNKVDWDKVSSNNNILWTASMLEKFKNRINWERLSNYGNKALFSVDNLERFQDYWNWKELSNNSDVQYSHELLEKFADKWDWSEIINNYNIDDCLNEDFLERYEDYIPASELQNSRLWRNLVEARKIKLTRDITTVK